MATASVVLPFAVQADTHEVFTSDMESALIIFLAEAKRRKLVFLEASEKIAFVSKMHYPLWLVPWKENSLVLDGLTVFSTSTTYQTLPSLDAFLEETEQWANMREQFRLILEKHTKTFDGFAEKIEVKIAGLVSNSEILSAMLGYIEEYIPLQREGNMETSAALVPIRLDAKTAIEHASQVKDLYSRIVSDLMGLEYAKKVLMETVNFHEQMVAKEIKFTQESYDEKISELLPTVEEKVKILEKKQDEEIAKINKTFEKILKAKEKEREKREKEQQKLELQKADLTRRQNTRRKRRNKIGLVRLEHRLKLCENKIREVKRRIRELGEVIEETRKQKESDVAKMQRSYREMIAKEKAVITSIENQRDEKILSKQREMENIRLAANHIANQIENLIKTKQQAIRELENLALHWQLEDATLLCLPFYLIGYKDANKTKLKTLAPIKVSSSKGFMQSFRSLIGVSSLKSGFYTQPQSKALSQMLESNIKKQIKADKQFAEALHSTINSANILVSKKFNENLRKGLEKLKAKGWIGQKEAEALTELSF